MGRKRRQERGPVKASKAISTWLRAEDGNHQEIGGSQAINGCLGRYGLRGNSSDDVW